MPDKSLGQHWLTDRIILSEIAKPANLTTDDVVLEIGPGLGTLTEVLSDSAKLVVAVEFDPELAKDLANKNIKNVEVLNADFLHFDLSIMPKKYKVVANIPYYITAKIVQKLLSDDNKPEVAALLVQKEVAERLAAKPGEMSILSVSAQVFAEVELGVIVPPEFFTPPPKVDSQGVILKPRNRPLFEKWNEKSFFRMVKAGFSNRRKKLRSSLAGGLGISKTEAENLLIKSGIDSNLRAQDLSLNDWQKLTVNFLDLK